jgi:glycosyltransferase involved in cell wall biosynthesis
MGRLLRAAKRMGLGRLLHGIEACLDQPFVVRLVALLLRCLALPRHPSAVRRSLWAGTPILNMAINARAERLLGVRADSLVFSTYFITRQFDYNLSRWMRVPVLRALLPHAVLFWSCVRYQRFHFYCDRGILPPRRGFEVRPEELRLLRDLGKEVFFWTYGGDVRTRGRTVTLGEHHCCLECPSPGRACVCEDRVWHEHLARLREHGRAVFAMGDMIEYTPGSRNDLFFWPVDLHADGGARYAPRYPDPDAAGPVRVVHAPNHRQFKGTRFIIAAVERLQSEGLAVELRLVERVPNREALEIYRTADIVFDQCLIGFHGYFALEALAMGKPVMVFIRDPQRYLLHPEECPFINTPAPRVEAVLRELVLDRPRLRALGRQGRRYIEKHFTLEAFAARLRRAYEALAERPGEATSRGRRSCSAPPAAA